MNNFNKFEDIRHKPLRTYNRAVMLANLLEDQGPEVAKEYASQFSDTEVREIAIVNAYVHQHGVQKAQQIVTKGLTLEDEQLH